MTEVKGKGSRTRVALDFPVMVGRRRIAALTVAPPTLDDLIALRAADPADPRALVSALTGEPLDVAGLIRWTDAEKILDAGMPMLPDDLGPGGDDGENAGPVSRGHIDDEPAFAPAPADESEPPPAMSDFLFRDRGLIIG
jgi:hypothetical protein